ncbi:MAG: hypothetical protein IJ660_01890 [Alphaproteobacteria bacterium]|nr:hypothetical protein [Alphaproteobacteria bacterium]
MNKISNKQLKTKIKLENIDKNDKQWCIRREKRIKVRQWAADRFYDYISYDFLYNLLYMMIHKKFVRWFGIDYHRITRIIHLFQDIYSKNLEESVHELFGGIDNEDEVEYWIGRYRWEIMTKEDNLIITIDEDIDYFNPNKEPDTTEYILPKYMLHNFLQFKQLFYDVVSKKYDVGAEPDFWLYACRYLLMEDKEFKIFFWGADGKNFPYKLIEKYNPKGLAAISVETRRSP